MRPLSRKSRWLLWTVVAALSAVVVSTISVIDDVKKFRKIPNAGLPQEYFSRSWPHDFAARYLILYPGADIYHTSVRQALYSPGAIADDVVNRHLIGQDLIRYLVALENATESERADATYTFPAYPVQLSRPALSAVIQRLRRGEDWVLPLLIKADAKSGARR